MPQNKLLSSLTKSFKEITFESCDEFRWSPELKTIFYVEELINEHKGQLLLLHELGHATLNHDSIEHDVDLLKKEVAAWESAEKLCKKFSVPYSEDLAEDCLDSYRMWLDKRSTCVYCEHTGYQTYSLDYKCLNCNLSWKVSLDQKKRVCRVVATKNLSHA